MSAMQRALLLLTSTGQPSMPQSSRAALGTTVHWLEELEPEQALAWRPYDTLRLTQIFPTRPNPSSSSSQQNETVKKKIEQLYCA